MSILTNLPAALGGCITLLVLFLLLRKPLAFLLRLTFRSSLWLAALAIFSKAAPLPALALGVNPLNALILGVLGLPGLGLLLMLRWVLN